MPITKKQLALLNIGKAKLGLTEGEYRAGLALIGAVESAKDLDQDSFDALMVCYERMGFVPFRPRGEDYGAREGMASTAQLALIRQLWHEYTHGEAGEVELTKWVLGKWHVSSLRFLTKADAQKAITALFAMKRRAA